MNLTQVSTSPARSSSSPPDHSLQVSFSLFGLLSLKPHRSCVASSVRPSVSCLLRRNPPVCCRVPVPGHPSSQRPSGLSTSSYHFPRLQNPNYSSRSSDSESLIAGSPSCPHQDFAAGMVCHPSQRSLFSVSGSCNLARGNLLPN